MPPPNAYGDQSIDPGFVGGINSMQYQAGFGGGGRPNFPPPFMSPMTQGGVSAYARPAGYMPFAPITPIGGDFGSPFRMAQQARYQADNSVANFGQAATGLGARIGVGYGGQAMGAAAGMAAAGAIFGPVGVAAGGVVGGIAGMLGADALMGDFAQRAGEGLLSPLTAGRQRALTLQNTSTNYLRRGPDMAPGGIGMSLGAATGLQQNLMHMADSKGFQRETGGRFNRQDVMKITQLAGEVGMLDQSQTAQEVATSVSKISKALANIMKIAGEPDVKKAMQMMGQMRMAGLSIPETQTAMANAKVFARMAGVSVGDVVAGAGQAASMFQERGMSAASGINAGMGAMGVAGIATSTMTARELSMAGGKEGVQRSYMQASANSASQDVLMMGALTRQGGKLGVDINKINDMISGRTSTSDAVRGTANALGGMQNVMEVMSTRKGELRDEMQKTLGPMMQTLMPMIQARMTMQSNPALSFGAALVTNGMDEQSARTMERNMGSRDFWRGLRQQAGQQRVDNRELIARERANTAERATEWEWTKPAKQFFGGQSMDRYGQRQADLTDIEVQTAASGGPLLSAKVREIGSSMFQQARSRDMSTMGQTGTADWTKLSRSAVNMRTYHDMQAEGGPLGRYGTMFYGSQGYGATEARQGGATDTDLVKSQMRFSQRFAYNLGAGEQITESQASKTLSERSRVGSIIERAAGVEDRGRTEARDTARTFVTANSKINEATFSKITAAAASSIVAKADQSYNSLGENYALEPKDIEESIKAAAKVAGITDQKSLAALMSTTNVQNTMNTAMRASGAKARTVLDETAAKGAQAAVSKQSKSIAAITEQSNRQRVSAGAKMGINLGFLRQGTSEQLSVLGDIIGGSTDKSTTEGVQTDMRQSVLSILALEKTGSKEDMARAVALEAELEKKYKDKPGELLIARKAVEVSLNKIDDPDKRDNFLKNIAGKNKATLQTAGEQFNQAAESRAAVGGIKAYSVLGADWAKTAGLKGKTAAYKQLMESEGYKDLNLDKDEQALIAKAATGDTKAQDALDARHKALAPDTDETTAGKQDLLTANELGTTNLEKTISELQSKAQEMNTDEFTVATGKFSEASDKMLKAAEALQNRSVVSGILDSVFSASPTTPGGPPPTTMAQAYNTRGAR